MPENANRDDADVYLEDRAAKGFNYVQIVAVRDLNTEPLDASIASRTMNPENRYSHRPFAWLNGKADVSQPIITPGGTPSAPNDYWDHLEYILQKARSLNMYVGLLPTWGLYYINNKNETLRIFTPAKAKAYGRFLGQRYASFSNLIWILGGDTSAMAHVDGRPIYRAMAEGIAQGVTGLTPAWDQPHPAWSQLLITYHGRPSASADFDADAWLKLNMVYESDPELLPNIQTHYQASPARPLLQGEASYEGITWAGDLKPARLIRRQLHHTFFAGGIGYTYGAAKSCIEKDDQIFRFQPGSGWRQRLDMQGATEMGHIKQVLDQSEWWRWKPAPQALGPLTESVAMVSAAADQLVVYYPSVRAESVDLSLITSQPRVKATWHDPMTGTQTPKGVFDANSTTTLTPPGTWEDAVLILEGTQDPVSAPTTAQFELKTIGGEVVIAAENYSYLGGSVGTWSLDKTNSGYLGTGFMRSSLDGSTLQFAPTTTSLNYIIHFDQTGTYYIHLRTLAIDHTENGFFATIDGAEVDYGGANPTQPTMVAYYIFVEARGKWWWYTDGGGANTRNLKVSFNISKPGKHVFSLYRRDRGSRVDHIWLTKHQSNAQQVETLSLPDPATFIQAQP